ncbi:MULTISPECIES: site-specific integrase [unclassified Serratia (in: enterobacteria)]|uniref:tyrosine-type recombinase/integrase n=1 Tax=unclassified Serratia (in: enterobacteria) TaxID=2647522 RepID=UPI00046A4FA5|nr:MULTISPECIES: site-specific integrase [unclassified Serratia (in: enterobacteria)]
MAISDTKLRSLHGKPYTGSPEVSDADGLSARISPKGVINFQYRYRWDGKAQRLGIGRYPAVSLKDARSIIAELRVLYDKKIDPRTYFEDGQDSGNQVTVKDCLDYWKANYVDVSLRDNTKALYESTVIKIMSEAFKGRPVAQITIKQWVDLFTAEEKLNSRRARQLLVQLRSAIGWCIRRHFINDCAVMRINPRDIGSRAETGSRVLTYYELAEIWVAIERSRAATSNKLLHQMLMLWGARVSELRLAERSEFDLQAMVWTVPKEHSKTGKEIRRPIFKQIVPLLEKAMLTYDNILFPGYEISEPLTMAAANRYIKRIRENLDIGYWRAHDFRRTLVTRLSEEGIAPHITEKMLGHELGGVMAVYNKHDWIEGQKEGYEIHAEKLLDHVKKLLSD